MAERFKERGIKPEWEVFGPQHILQDVCRLIAKGYDKPPYFINMVLGADRGFQGAMPYSHDILASMIRLLPPLEHLLRQSAIGPAQLARHHPGHPAGRPRPGWAGGQQLLRQSGQLATNEQLVARTVRIIKELNLEPASPAEARDMLGLPVPAAAYAAAHA